MAIWHEPRMIRFTKTLKFTVAGASAGTLIEWYDFFLYGAIAPVLAKTFFSGLAESTAYLFALLTFAAGFLVRPLGALIFGGIGDRWGRKNTFLLTMSIMGAATMAVGFIPSYTQIGLAAPVLLISVRLLQGMAVGGEYGGAATFIAEHSPNEIRGLTTSFIQLTCTLGLFLALLVVVLVRAATGVSVFEAWAWRIPFLISAILLAIAIWIRLRLDESAMFKRRAEEGTLSRAPIKDSFSSWEQTRAFLLSTFCLTAGMTVIFYTSQFYVLTFMQRTLHVDEQISNTVLLVALALGSPFFILFGWLSDRIGRKKIMVAGFVLAGLTYYPLFLALGYATNPELLRAMERAPVEVTVVENECSSQLDPIAPAAPATVCDALRRALATAGVQYETTYATDGLKSRLRVGERVVLFGPNGAGMTMADVGNAVQLALRAEGYPERADPVNVNVILSILIITLMVVYVAMAYAPLAATLAEMFPLAVRYTSLSTSYNLSVGWIGGLLPSVAFAIVISSGKIFYGLIYPISITLIAALLTIFLFREKRDVDISK
jgi:MFS family permease